MDFEALEDLLMEDVVANRVIGERCDPIHVYSDFEFHKRYHLRKDTVLYLAEELKRDLEPEINYPGAIDPLLQILVTLRLLTGCTLQHVSGDLHHLSQASVSRIFAKVIESICSLRHRFIQMPNNLADIKTAFYQYGGFPGVIACVDGTHVPIAKPKLMPETEVFRCRKGYYSLNVQIVCGPNYLIYDVVARWPGSTHDSRVFDNSTFKQRLETIYNGIVLADGGYACRR
jgi:hypothetical protein